MVKRLAVIALLACVAAGSVPALAEGVTPQQMYETLFTAEAVSPEWFTEEVLRQVPASALDAILAEYKKALGEYITAEGSGYSYTLYFTGGTVESQIVLDAQGRVAGLWFGLPQPNVSGFEEVLAEFAALPGTVSLLVASDNGVLAALQPDVPLAVGSAFKLAVAAALKDQVNAGILAWDDVVVLEERHKSLPTGILQDWPAGTPLTVQAAATLMISLSDNTATDLLLEVVGRENVEMYTAYNRPILTTGEAFRLKDPANAELLAAWRQGGEGERRALLSRLAEVPLPDASIFYQGPVAIDVEWFFSAQELAALIGHVRDLPFMSVNPGVANPADWQHVAFKGGSEPGVLNLTTFLVGQSGANYAVVATWNNDAAVLDETKFVHLYSGLLSAVKAFDAQRQQQQ